MDESWIKKMAEIERVTGDPDPTTGRPDDNTYVSEYEANEYAKRQLYIGDRVQSTWDRRLVGKICGFGAIAGGPPFYTEGNPVEPHLVYLVALEPAIQTEPIKEQPFWRVQVLPMHIDRVVKL